eukprot:TRINITY_DN2754_c0_g3_i1.p1 TRINITY_DN2754_c0_g3~~TRINITY_DN2754_c0_g3_i1.p1  ORF type:complete len:430 (-),score=-7.51 TRINITY_DN2754_c0_g3_i1:954-2243(-)
MRTRRADYSSQASERAKMLSSAVRSALDHNTNSLKRKSSASTQTSTFNCKFFKKYRSEQCGLKERGLEEFDSSNIGRNSFEGLPDDLIIAILRCLSSSASRPSDFAHAKLTCRRFYAIGMHPLVLMVAGRGALAVGASHWCDQAHRFLKRCADVGNLEACYMLGMISFYCLGNKTGGTSLMAKAAVASHAPALHSLAIIQFNGSGGTKTNRDLKAGVALCARAAALGHIDAMRELGHCLQDGYGVPKNITEGRRLLLQANAREASAAGISPPLICLQNAVETTTIPASFQRPFIDYANFCRDKKTAELLNRHQNLQHHHNYSVFSFIHRTCCSLLSDFGCNVPLPEPHIANKFLADWFSLYPPQRGHRLCSNFICGRPEMRWHEFRRCSACSSVNYCSRACQALHWKTTHRHVCVSADEWQHNNNNAYD